jgi:hypothetical protein
MAGSIKRPLNELVGAVISVLVDRMRFLVLHACMLRVDANLLVSVGVLIRRKQL